MKLPVKVLQGLAAAVALAGMAGCNFAPGTAEAPTTSERAVQQPNNAHNHEPVMPQMPDGCPACGRG